MKRRMAAVLALVLLGAGVPAVAQAHGRPKPGTYCKLFKTWPGQIRVHECANGSVRVERWDAERRTWIVLAAPGQWS